MKQDYILLRRAYIKFARKSLNIAPKVKNWNGVGVASIHTLPRSCRIVRIGENEIAVTDGGYGYTPFYIDELQTMLREAKKLPIVKSFRVDTIA